MMQVVLCCRSDYSIYPLELVEGRAVLDSEVCALAQFYLFVELVLKAGAVLCLYVSIILWHACLQY